MLVRPETVVRWHRRGWRLVWRWKSRCRLGRPRLSVEVQTLIATMAAENPELVHLNVTASPTAAWVWRQLIAATPWGRQPRYLVRDRDAVYGRKFLQRARRPGIETVLTPVRAPRANAIAERRVGTLRRACLDHLVIVNQAHLRAVLTEFHRYYNTERAH